MSDEKDNGGPAFPRPASDQTERDPANGSNYKWSPKSQEGMTLRDYFAAKAMQGVVSSIATEDDYRRLSGHASASGLTVSEWIARDAFKQADAMLKAREVK